MSSEQEQVIGWHFSDPGFTIDYRYNFNGSSEERRIKCGDKLEVDPRYIEPCRHGLHASKRVLHAAAYASSGNNGVYWTRNSLSLVLLSGRIKHVDKAFGPPPKMVASERTHFALCTNADEVFERFSRRYMGRSIPIPSVGQRAHKSGLYDKNELHAEIESMLFEYGWWCYDDEYEAQFLRTKQQALDKATPTPEWTEDNDGTLSRVRE